MAASDGKRYATDVLNKTGAAAFCVALRKRIELLRGIVDKRLCMGSGS